MRTRCPECSTVFRVTSEQLRRKAGKVRCGHCQAIFNAFDQWQADPPESEAEAPLPATDLQPLNEQLLEEAPIFEAPALEAEPVRQVEASLEASPSDAADEPEDWVPETEVSLEADERALLSTDLGPASEKTGEAPVSEPLAVPVATIEPAMPADDTPREVNLETPEESTLAAREAGLVAARELTETAAYNRWAAGTLAGDSLGAFGGEPARRAVWPFVLVSVALLVALLGQLLYHFRTEVVLRFPDAAALYRFAAIDIPLSRNPALVSIETSDLQSDNARGLFVLQATLKNRAGHAQAWPALELSLTDTNDTVVSRRVMYAAEYLPPGTTADAFPANGEIAVKLWIEAKNIGASGYRLYIFYP